VEQTQCGKIGPVIVLEEQGLAVQGVYGEMISAVLWIFKTRRIRGDGKKKTSR
jgi:hypothetical protein